MTLKSSNFCCNALVTKKSSREFFGDGELRYVHVRTRPFHLAELFVECPRIVVPDLSSVLTPGSNINVVASGLLPAGVFAFAKV